jgi:CheY-like chemotaxis protein
MEKNEIVQAMNEQTGKEEKLMQPDIERDVAASSMKRQILVVDDNCDAAESLAAVLEFMGNKTRWTHDGSEALRVAAESTPEVMLIDIGMPGMNGYELARAVRSKPWGTEVVLIALTGWGQDDDRRQAREAGFDAHILKPADPTELERLLQSLMPAAA